MKILVVGYHNKHFMNTVILREKALAYLGHEVFTFDDASYFLPGRLRQRFSFLENWDLKRLNLSLIDFCQHKRPDVCLIVGGQPIFPQTVMAIKALGISIALWTTDVPKDFNNILKSADIYDQIFCAGSEAIDLLKSHGFSKAQWLPFACDRYFHQTLKLSDKDKSNYAKDIAFVGSYYPNRAQIFESICDMDLGVWGPYWHKLPVTSPLRSKAISIKMNVDQWVKIFNACKINVVVHYQDGKVPCFQASPKLFEAMSCGAFILCDRQKDVKVLFEDKKHLVYFDSSADLREKIIHYLNNPQERTRIALEGQKEVLIKHQYEQRMAFILNKLCPNL